MTAPTPGHRRPSDQTGRMDALPPLSPPPRHVPASLVAVLALRHPLALVGWLLLAIGGPLAAAFVPRTEPFGDPFAQGARRAVGRVVAVAGTSMSVNGRTVQEVTIEWPADAPRRTAIGFADGDAPRPGTELALAWLPEDPPRVRAEGLRTHPFPAAARFVLLFPALGFALLAIGGVAGWRRARLLRDGELVLGERTAAAATNVRINRRQVHALTYRFVDARGAERTATARSHRFDPAAVQEPLLLAPDGPRIVRLADLPSALRLDRDGQIQPAPFGALAIALLPPTLAAVGWSLLQSLAP